MKKKLAINKALFNNRHCAVFMFFVFVFVAVIYDSFVVNAENYDYQSDVVSHGGNGSFVSSGLAIDVFGWDKNENDRYPFLNYNTIESYYSGSGVLINGGSANGSGFPTITAYSDWIYSNSGERTFLVPSEVTAQDHTSSMAINGAFYLASYAPNTASSQQFIRNYMFQSAGNIAIITYWTENNNSLMCVVSDQPLYYQWTRSMEYFGDVTTVCCGLVDESSNGLYIYGLNTYEQVWVTNMPIYLGSSDKSTGFYTLDEFSFSNNNQQFNYLLTNGEVDDPVGGGGSSVSDQTKVNLKFRDDAYYVGTGLNAIYHVNKFTFNEYQIDNPLQFKIKTDYKIHFKNNLGVDDYFFYSPGDVELSNFLAQSSRLNQGNKLVVPLHSNYFVNQSGTRLTNYIISTINHVTDESVEYINPNGLFETIIHWTDTINQWAFGDGELTSGIPIIKNIYDGVIEDFTIYSEISIYAKDDEAFTSYPYKDSHSFVTGKSSVDSTENTTSPYSSDLPDVPSSGFVSDQSGNSGINASGNSAVATIQKGAVQIVNNVGGNSSGGFMISNQDWNEYGNLIESMSADMRSLTQDEGASGVFAMCKKAYEVFPAKIWSLIALGIGGSITIALWKKGTQCH